jgi:hypothetical protein
MVHCAAIPSDVNPAVRPALDALAVLLTDYHYSAHATTLIVAYVAAEGTLAGAPGLDAEDEADAEMVFVAELEPVAYDAPDWGAIVPPELDPDAGCPPVPDPLPDYRSPEEWEAIEPGPIEPPDSWEGDGSVGWASLPPIRGGGPEPDERDAQDHRDWLASVAGSGPFVPSPADLAEMHAHRDAVELIYGYE